MNIPEYIRHIPATMEATWKQITDVGQSIHAWFLKFWETKCQDCIQHPLWQNYGKPFYIRNIQPLDRTDFILLAGSLAAADLVITIALEFFGNASLPPAIAIGILIFLNTFSFSRQRINKYFNDIAWGHVNLIRKAVHETTYKNLKFDQIEQQTKKLEEPQFSHLEARFKELNEEVRKFKNVALGVQYQDKLAIVLAHLATLKDHVHDSPEDMELVASLEKEINKVGNGYDLAEIEKNKQSLKGSTHPQMKNSVAELTKQIDEMIQALQGPNLTSKKKDFLTYLENFQKKLSPNKILEILPDDQLPQVAPNPESLKEDQKKAKEHQNLDTNQDKTQDKPQDKQAPLEKPLEAGKPAE